MKTRIYLRQGIILVVFYFLAGKLGWIFGSANGIIPLVWPPIGFSLTSFLVIDRNFWPVLGLGAFLVNYFVTGSAAVALTMALVSTLVAYIGATMLLQVFGFRNSMQRWRDVSTFIVVNIFLSGCLCTVMGFVSAFIFHFIPTSRLGIEIAGWWLGNIGADLTIAPFLLTWSTPVVKEKGRKGYWFEAILLAVTLIFFSIQVFFHWPHLPYSYYLSPYMVVPFLVWSAYRFWVRGTTFVLLAIYSLGIFAAWNGVGVFQSFSWNEALMRAHIFVGLLAPVFLLLGAAISEWKLSEKNLEKERIILEDKCRHRTEKLILKEAQLEKAQAIARMGSWERDLSTNTVTWSKQTFVIFGLEPTDSFISFGDFISRVHPEDKEDVVRQIQDMFIVRKPYRCQYRVIRPDGSIRTLHSAGEVVRDDSGHLSKVAGIIYDITDQIRVEEERTQLFIRELSARQEAEEALLEARNARFEAENANKTKDLFLATVSHELRTPLTTILSWAQILRMKRSEFDTASINRGLEKIEDSARVQEQMIRDLLDLSRIMTGKFSLVKQDIDPISVIRLAADSLRPLAEAKAIRIEFCFTEPLRVIEADPVRLKQVIWNLLSNSIKFTPRGGRIYANVMEIGDELQVSVADNGCGFSPGVLQRLFVPFQQADVSSTRRHGGLGLGLSIVKNIVELHGGRVSAESEGEGMGAKFSVFLPKRKEKLETPSTEISSPVSISIPDLKGLRILLVDDDQNALESTRTVLQSFGAVVYSASSVSEALAVFDECDPQVLISDIAMPEEDGYSLLIKLREKWAERRRQPTPAIALTAYAAETDRKRASEAGYQEHLAKPVDVIRLVTTVKKLAA